MIHSMRGQGTEGRHEHLISTPIGRVGIGICADNQDTAHLELMHRLQAGLVLMPHAWPTPAKAGGPVKGRRSPSNNGG